MPGAALSLNISADDLAKLRDLPEQIQSVATTARQLLDSVQSGDSGNPVGALISGLGNLGDQVGEIPALEPIIAPIRDLASQLPSTALGDVASIQGEIEALLRLFGPLKDAILSGQINDKLTDFIEQALEQTGGLFSPSQEVTTLFKELEQFLRLFQAMLGWKDQPPQPEIVAELISRALAGMAPDLLDAPARALETALAPLESLLPEGPDLTTWRGLPGGRRTFWQQIDGRVGGTIDWARLETDLRAEAHLLIDSRALRDRLFAGLQGTLARVDLRGIDQAAAAIKAVPSPRDFRLGPFMDGLRRQLASTAEDLEHWTPTEEEMRQITRSLLDDLVNYIEQGPLGQIRTLLIDLQQRLMNAIESLPFRELARQAEDALRHLADVIQVVDPNIIRQPIHEFFTGIEQKLDEFSDETIGTALDSLWSGVENAMNEITSLMDTLRTTIEGFISQLQSLVENVGPAMEQISEAVGTVKTTLDNFDLSQPTEAVVNELNEIRDKVAELDLSSLPDAAVSAIKAAAEFLRKIDLAGAVNPPLNDALGQVDPTPLIAQAAKSISGVTSQLQLLDPANLTKTLDKPVEELLGALSNFGPEQLEHLLQQALRPVEDAIHSLDFGPLLAPITRLFAEISAKVDAILNPDVIFAPLEELFKPVVRLIDELEPGKFIDRISPHGTSFAEKIGGAAGPPGQITAAGLKNAIPAGPESADDLFGFRIGDLLMPLIDFHRQITKAFDQLNDEVLSAAGARLRSLFQGRLESLNPINISSRIDAALDGIQVNFAPPHLSASLSGSVQSFHLAAGKIAAAARQNLSSADSAIATRVLALLPDLSPLSLVPDSSQFDGILTASAQVRANVNLSSLRTSFSGLSKVQTLLPEFLRVADLSAGSLRQALRDLDPAPIRDEINEVFDRIGRRVVALKDMLFAGLAELGKIAEEFLLPISPGALVQVANRLHAALKQQLLEFHPSRFKDEIKLIFDTVKRQLAAFDPAIIVEELNGLRDALIQKLRDLLKNLLPDPAPFHELQTRVAQLKPSQMLAPLVETLKPVSDLIATLDPKVLFQPLIDAIARIRLELPEMIAEVEGALDEVLAAFPEGGGSGASASGSVSIG